MKFGCTSLATLCLIASLPVSAADGGPEPAPERVEKALISNLKSQLVYGSFKDNFSLERSTSHQLLIANNVRYHTGLFSSPSGDISSAVKERCAVIGGTYAAAGDEINAGTLLDSREDNGRWVSKGVTVSPGYKVRTFTCEKDAVPVVHAILLYKGSRTAGGNVFSADFYDFRVIEKTADFPSPEDRRTYLSNAAAMGSKLAGAELAPMVAAERAERERQQQVKDRAAAEERARLESERTAAEAARMRELKARLPQFRANLKVGDDTNCGLVVEVKQSIALIQTTRGTQWVKLSDLWPAGERCAATVGASSTPPQAEAREPSPAAGDALRACRFDRRDAFKASPFTTCVTGDAKLTFAQIRSRCELGADNEAAVSGARPAITDIRECPPAEAICTYRSGGLAGMSVAFKNASDGVVNAFRLLCENSQGGQWSGRDLRAVGAGEASVEVAASSASPQERCIDVGNVYVREFSRRLAESGIANLQQKIAEAEGLSKYTCAIVGATVLRMRQILKSNPASARDAYGRTEAMFRAVAGNSIAKQIRQNGGNEEDVAKLVKTMNIIVERARPFPSNAADVHGQIDGWLKLIKQVGDIPGSADPQSRPYQEPMMQVARDLQSLD